MLGKRTQKSSSVKKVRPAPAGRETRDQTTLLLGADGGSANGDLFRKLFAHAAVGLAITELDHRFLEVNQVFCSLTGYSEAELKQTSFLEIIQPTDRSDARLRLRSLLAGETSSFVVERRLTRRDGGRVWIQNSVSLVHDHNGRATHFVTLTEDITERKRAEEELRGAKEFSEKLIQTANVIVLGLDVKARINIFNQTAEKITGYTFSELEGKSWFDTLVPRERYPHVWEEFGGLVASDNMPSTFENPILTKNGEERYIAWRNNQVSVDGKVVGIISFGNDVTERKQVEIAQREAERKYRDIFENAVEGIFQTTPAGGFIAANPALAHMLGYESPEELIRERRDIALQGYVDPNGREEFQRLLETQGTVAGFEHQVYRKDRTRIWISENARAARDASGKLLYYEGTVEDITERKRAEAKSVAFGALARKLSGARVPLHAAQIIVDTADELFGWDSCTFDLYDPDEHLIHAILRIDTIEGLRSDVSPVLETRSPTARGRDVIERGARLTLREAPHKFDDDTLRFGDKDRPSASIMSVPIRHAAEVVGILSIQSYEPQFYDHDALGDLQALADHCGEALNRIWAEEELRESEERYRDLVENSRELICTHDLDGLILSANPAAAAAIGYDLDEYVGKKTVRDLLAPEVSHQFDQYMARLRKDGTTSGIMLVQTRSGERRIWEYYNSLRTEGVATPIVRGMARDITDRKRAENALQESEERFRQLSDAAFEVIILHDQGTILDVNQSFCRMYGYERAEVIGKSVLDLALPEFCELLRQRVRSGDPGSFEGPALRKDGTTFRAEVAGKPIHYQGRVVRVAAIRDITEQKRNERRQAAQYAVTRVLAESATLAEAAPQLLQVICESLRWKIGEFWRVCERTNLLRCVETWHVPALDATSFIEASRQTELAPDAGLPGRVWQSGQPAWIPDVMTDPGFARAAIAAKVGLRGAVAFPILLGNHTLGVMLFFSRRDPEVDEDLLKIMSAIGSQIGQFTERKRAEEALRESEERYRDLVENSREFICTHDLGGLILSANRAAVEVLGYDPKDYCGTRNFRELLVPEVRDQFDDYLTRIRRDGVASGLMLLQTSSGERRLWEYYNTLRTEGVATPIVRGMARDITDQRRAEEALRASEKRFRTLIENSSDAIVLLDADGMIIDHAPRTGRVMGYANESFVGRDVLEIIHPEDRALVRRALNELVTGEAQGIAYQFRALHRNGSWRWAEAVAATHLGDPEVKAIVVNYRDITERKQAEAALRESEERLRLALDAAHMGTFDWDVPRNRITWSRWHEELWGYKPGEFDGTYEEFSERVHPDDLQGINAEVARCIAAREPFVREFRVVWPDGSVHWVKGRGEFTFGDDGQAVRMRGVVVETTARKLAEEALRTSEERLRVGLKTANIAVFNQDLDLRYIWMYQPQLGYTSEQGTGHTDAELLPPEAARQIMKIKRRVLESGVKEHAEVPVSVGGQTFVYDLVVEPLRDANSAIIGLTGASLDITERKRAEMERDVISEVTQSVNQTSNLDELLTQVHQSLKRVLYAENCCVALFDKQTGLFEAPLFVDLVEANPFPIPPSKNCTAKVFSSGQPLLMNEAIFDELLDRGEVELIGRPSPSFLAVPLMTPAETIGVIVVQHYEKDNVYSQRDVEFLSAVAAQLALAIERKRAETALRESEERFRAQYQNIPLPTYTWQSVGGDFVLVEYNHAAEEYTRGRIADLIGKSATELYVDSPEVMNYLRRCYLEQTAFSQEVLYRLRTLGEERYLRVSYASVAPDLVMVHTDDITERKQAEAALRESEERYRDLVENSHELICTHDLEGKILSANRAATQLLGYDPNEFIGKGNIRNILAPEVCHQFDEYMARVCKDGATSGTMLVQTSSGERRVWEYYNSLRTEGVATPIVRGIARDITEQRHAEKAMSDLRRELESTMNSMQEGVHRVDLDGNIVFENPAAVRMLGWKVAELLGKPAHPTMHHTRQDGTPYPQEECPIYATFRDGLSRQVADEVFWRQDRTSFPVEYMTAPMRNERNETVATVVTFRDITERKQAEAALRESEERYRELFENDKDAIYVHDLKGVYTSVNRAAEKLSGYSRKEILGKPFWDFVSPEYLTQVDEKLGKKLAEPGETNYEVDIINRDGAHVPVEVSSRLIYENGVAIGVQGSARDITERKRAQEALLTYSRRLIAAQEAERGRIARELHDQIGQMLTALKLNLHAIQSARNEGEAGALIEDNLKMLDEALEHVRDLSVDVRPLLLDDLGLVAALRWYVDHQAQRAGMRAEFTCDSLDPDVRFSSELETACFRIAQEALTNVARHARAKAVTVRLSRNGDYLILRVEDDGEGFDIEALQRHALAGATLGLQGMEERAHAAGGRIKIDSASDKGTQVFVELPIAMPDGAKPQP